VLVCVSLLIGTLVRAFGRPGFDGPIIERCHGWLDTSAGPIFERASQIGYGALLLLVALVASVMIGLVLRSVRVGIAPVAACGAGIAINPLVKQLFDRPRPNLESAYALTSLSMPSGHATSSAALATALVLVLPTGFVRWIAGVPLVAAAALVGVSRLVLGVHWPSDVLAGWLFGAGVAFLSVAAVGGALEPVEDADTRVPAR